jgi:hypothetical protein
MTLAEIVVRLEQMTAHGAEYQECPSCGVELRLDQPALVDAVNALRLDIEIAIFRQEHP